VTITIERW